LWQIALGDNSATGGLYNWSSPLIYNGYAYIGTASCDDEPLVAGQLLQIGLTTGQIVNRLTLVPPGQLGAGIWTSPAVDPSPNTISLTTGTEDPRYQQPLSQAMVAVDASTFAVRAAWQIPLTQTVTDADMGNSPVLYTDAQGRPLVVAVNKNGIV